MPPNNGAPDAPATLFEKITAVIEDERCLGGAVAVEYDEFERKWMKFYLLGWKFWGTVFNMAQGATQFCRKSVFAELNGNDQNIFMGEDVEFYWRLTKFAKRQKGYLHFIEDPKVKTSARRFDKMSLWKTLLLTHPIIIRLNGRKKSFWTNWYEKARFRGQWRPGQATARQTGTLDCSNWFFD